jgi:hypothetical protein
MAKDRKDGVKSSEKYAKRQKAAKKSWKGITISKKVKYPSK